MYVNLSSALGNINVQWHPLLLSILLAYISVYLSRTLTSIYINNEQNGTPEVSFSLVVKTILGFNENIVIELLLFWFTACLSFSVTFMAMMYAILFGGITSDYGYANNTAGKFLSEWLKYTTSLSDISLIIVIFIVLLLTFILLRFALRGIYTTKTTRQYFVYSLGYIVIAFEKIILLSSTVSWTSSTIFLIYHINGILFDEYIIIIIMPIFFFLCFLSVSFNVVFDKASKKIAGVGVKKFTGNKFINGLLQMLINAIIKRNA